jgi:hypothetical protein
MIAFFVKLRACDRIKIDDVGLSHEYDIVDKIATGCLFTVDFDDLLLTVKAPLDCSVERRDCNHLVGLGQKD